MEIQVKNLKKCFGEKTAVDIPELKINSSDVIGLVGNNGAGKTTLFRLLLDLLKADTGTVEFYSSSLSTSPLNPTESEEWKNITGAYIDDGFLIDFLTPEEYFDFIGKANGLGKNQIQEYLETMSSFMSDEIIGQKKLIRDFSAGNKQKIGIIGSMLNRPQLLMLDEPFNFLDPSSQNILKKILKNYCEESHATILVSSHNLQHTVEVSNRVLLMEHGLIIKDIDNTNGLAEKELENYFNV